MPSKKLDKKITNISKDICKPLCDTPDWMPVKYIEVSHEEILAILDDPKRCEELGIDREFEILRFNHAIQKTDNPR